MKKALATLTFLVIAGTALAADSDTFEFSELGKLLLGQAALMAAALAAFWKRTDHFIIRSTLSTEQITSSMEKLDKNVGEITKEIRKLTRSNDALMSWKDSAVEDRQQANEKLEELSDKLGSFDRRITVLEVQGGA